jgi:pyruvate/2-oxoacid:ferredoxin oxidoreductase alpha subunit
MKIIVSGSRTYWDESKIHAVLAKILWSLPINEPVTLIHGGAKGADTIAATFGASVGLDVIEYQPDWKAYGKAAGPIRNAQMVHDHSDADIVLVFWDGSSKGAANLLEEARAKGLKTNLYIETGAPPVKKSAYQTRLV